MIFSCLHLFINYIIILCEIVYDFIISITQSYKFAYSMKQGNQINSKKGNDGQNQKYVHPKIMISAKISQKQLSQPLRFGLKLIVCNFLSTPKLQFFLDESLDNIEQLYITKCESHQKQLNKHEKKFPQQIYLIYMVNDNDILNQHQKVLQGCVGLANKVILIDIDNQRQSYVQKIFFDSVNTFSRIRWVRANQQPRLVLIKQCYQENAHQNNEIEYFTNIQRYAFSLSQSELRHKNQIQKTQLVTHAISINEFIKIYQNFMNSAGSESWKVRYSLQKIYELKQIDHTYNELQQMIFNSKNRKNFLKYLEKSILPQDFRKKLIWKRNMIDKYQKRVQEQSKITSKQCQNKLLNQISQQECMLWMDKYHRKWLEQSLDYLKQHFNNIASHKDTKSIDYFRRCYQQMIQNVGILLMSFKDGSKQVQQHLNYVLKQLQTFISYHQDLITNKKMSGIKFIYQEVKYTLKHRRKIKQKMVLFVLFLILALLQNNLIAGITIGTVGIIMLSINI